MPKKGMKRPEWTHTQPRNEVGPVPELQGGEKRGKDRARPIVSGTEGAELKVWHTEKPMAHDAYAAIDTDLAMDNLQNDIPAADSGESY